MAKWFPINFELNRGIPINNHPGSFGHVRKYDIHSGVDLYGKPGDWVRAINNGEVVAISPFTGPVIGCGWWLPTECVIVKSETEYFVYGEVEPRVSVGDHVKAGDRIADLVPVLPPDKFRPDIPQHSTTMLHLEKYDLTYDVGMGWPDWPHFTPKKPWLQDPTNDLISILQRKHRRVDLLTM